MANRGGTAKIDPFRPLRMKGIYFMEEEDDTETRQGIRFSIH